MTSTPGADLAYWAATCTEEGVVVTVVRDNLHMQMEPGCAIASRVNPDSQDKFFAFIKEVQTRGSAFGYDVFIDRPALPERVYLAAISEVGMNRFNVVATRTRGELAGAWQAQRVVALGEVPDLEFLIRRSVQDEQSFDELTRINNEIVTAHRQLARANQDLTASLAREERLRLELESARSELEASLEFKDEILGFAWHEVGSPLTILQGVIRMLSSRELSREEARELLNDAYDATRRMTITLKSIFALSRSEVDPDIELDAVALAPALAQAIDDARAANKQREVTLRSMEQLRVIGNDQFIQIIVVNLVGNAMKYSPAGTPIEVDVEPAQDEVVVSVLDRGPGVHPEELGVLFRPFTRTQDAVASMAKGSGLGLAISRRIADRLGSKIWAENRDGGGLAVRFTLRRA